MCNGHHLACTAGMLKPAAAGSKYQDSKHIFLLLCSHSSLLSNEVICTGFAPGVAVIYLEQAPNGSRGHPKLVRSRYRVVSRSLDVIRYKSKKHGVAYNQLFNCCFGKVARELCVFRILFPVRLETLLSHLITESRCFSRDTNCRAVALLMNVSTLIFFFLRDMVLVHHILLSSRSGRYSKTSRGQCWGCTLHHLDTSVSQSKILLLCVSIPNFLVIWKLSPGYKFPFHLAIEQVPPSCFGRELEKLVLVSSISSNE